MIEVDAHASQERLRNELQGVARDEGLTPAKLESTQLIALVAELPGWSIGDTTRVLYKLIAEVVADLRGEKARTAARATLNLDGSPVQGRSAMGRQAALAAKRAVHPDTVRAWWRSAVKVLADTLPLKINELNNDPVGWTAYRDSSPLDSSEQPDYSFDRIEVAWRLQGKRAFEMTTSRWLVARTDGVDRVITRGWYFTDRGNDTTEIIPLLNCEKVSTTRVGRLGRDFLISELKLPSPLKPGESVFYAYKIIIPSDVETETVFYHNVTSAGVKHLQYRIQFDASTTPAHIWTFTSFHEIDAITPPPQGSSRYLTTNRLGYTECVFRECVHGTKSGVSWIWP